MDGNRDPNAVRANRPSGIGAWLRRQMQRCGGASADSRHLAVGIWGEGVAETALRAKGYRLLGRRVRVGRRDEIDLVMRDAGTLVFVEVRTRANEDFGAPAASLGPRKKRALARAARRYLRQSRDMPAYYRFDIVEVVGSPSEPDSARLRHIEAALTIASAPFALSDGAHRI